jgi:N-acetylmuramic acid 6-phosphate (MurNAc-6-P) etherase
MKGRLPIVLSITAVLIAVAASTPLGHAASNAVRFARNADKVDGIHASRSPKAGRLLALNRSRKFPASVIPTTTTAIAGHEVITGATALDSSTPKAVVLNCTAGKKVLGGGATVSGGGATEVSVTESYPSAVTQWTARAVEVNATGATWRLSAYAICAVAS